MTKMRVSRGRLAIEPVEYAGFILRANHFFAANPVLDFPGEAKRHAFAVVSRMDRVAADE